MSEAFAAVIQWMGDSGHWRENEGEIHKNLSTEDKVLVPTE